VTARSYARAAIAAPSIEKPLREVLRSSAPAAAKTCEGKGEELSCAFQWTENEGEFRRSTEPVSGAGLGEVFDVLEVVQGLLYEKAGSVSNNSSDTPSGSPSGGPSGNPGGTPTGSAQPARDTGAAGRVSVAWAGVGFAALLAAFGML
jgi:mannan endo-1,6-alpha-mannosidase